MKFVLQHRGKKSKQYLEGKYRHCMNMSEKRVASEDEPGEKWDRCIADAIVKTGTGFGLGLAFSLLLFKRRPWPVALGSGFGLGYATSNCQHDFRRVQSVHLKPVVPVVPLTKIKAAQAPPTETEATPTTPAPQSPPTTSSPDKSDS